MITKYRWTANAPRAHISNHGGLPRQAHRLALDDPPRDPEKALHDALIQILSR